MTFTAQDVKTLREKTGAGMMDCKRALAESGGDTAKALDFLKRQGLAKAGQRQDRRAAEGLVFSRITPESASAVELNCETDFVARNEEFAALGRRLAEEAFRERPASAEDFLTQRLDGSTVADKVASFAGIIGEKITLRRCCVLTPRSGGRIGGYVHMGGKIVVLAEIKGAKVTDEVLKDVGMQIAAMNPAYTDKSEVPAALMDKERETFIEPLRNSGKPAEIVDKIVRGKLDKFASEMSLLQQVFVKDASGKKTVAQHLKELDPQAKVVRFVRLAAGEGIEKR